MNPDEDHHPVDREYPDTIMRVLDANANRAAEGLRTLEETARFVLNAHALTSRLKTLRHDLATAIQLLPRMQLLRARDTAGDVGTNATTQSEHQRSNVRHIVSAGTGRTQQALRCLEEYGKIVDAEMAKRVEQIRYRCYDVFAELEQVCVLGGDRLSRLQRARVYALIDGGEDETAMVQRIGLLADAGVDIIQLRDRSLDDRTLFERAVAGTAVTGRLGVLWIINDRADIAAASNADGVHVGQEELPVGQVRRIVGSQSIVGLSTHDIHQVREAFASTADYIGCGPVFPGITKQFERFPGCDFLCEVSREISSRADHSETRPAFAIGGIGASNIDQVVRAGFGRVAMSGAIAGADSAEVAREVRTKLETVPIDNPADMVIA
ncbi:thiamine phosphate synthase [Rhodopirellula sallentina]|uniref:Thiamine-phosphate synthase n=1 Tax=Rhodopirellula sallentina SM41 TaxID=1263870 RepID=M5U884_9BACT|nr:thiamine phosphate synthase [Rhodopirellula sallentina]EMI57489.1 thiamine-phosphate pyrophosphorylase [Rhodopirellula sallentina SM41]